MKATIELPTTIGTIYMRQIDARARIWGSGGWEAASGSSFAASIKTSFTDPESSGRWEATCPTGAVQLAQKFEVRLQAGGSPAASDTVLGTFEYQDYLIQEMACVVHMGRRVYFTFPDGSATGVEGRTPGTCFKTLDPAIAATEANKGDVVVFNGPIEHYYTDPDLYDILSAGALLDHRQVRIKAGSTLKGPSLFTAVLKTDSDAPYTGTTGGAAVTVDGVSGVGNAYMAGFSIEQVFGPQGSLFTTPLGYNTNPTTNVGVSGVRVAADTDGFYFSANTGTGTGRWRIFDSFADVNYDAHVILGTNTDQEIEFFNCWHNVVGPSANNVPNIGRALASAQGITRCFGGGGRTTTTNEAITNDLNVVYARSGGGIFGRIELYGYDVRSKVSGSYAGNNNHIRVANGATVLLSNATFDKGKVVNDGSGTLIYQNTLIEANEIRTNALVDIQATRAAKIDNLDVVWIRGAIGLDAATLTADLDEIKLGTNQTANQTNTIVNKLDGITKLSDWLGLLGGKTLDSVTLAEFNATPAGLNFNNATDSQEAVRDRGDAAWTTGSVGSSGNTYKTDENSYSEGN